MTDKNISVNKEKRMPDLEDNVKAGANSFITGTKNIVTNAVTTVTDSPVLTGAVGGMGIGVWFGPLGLAVGAGVGSLVGYLHHLTTK